MDVQAIVEALCRLRITLPTVEALRTKGLARQIVYLEMTAEQVAKV